jgi:hypothetical protein
MTDTDLDRLERLLAALPNGVPVAVNLKANDWGHQCAALEGCGFIREEYAAAYAAAVNALPALLTIAREAQADPWVPVANGVPDPPPFGETVVVAVCSNGKAVGSYQADWCGPEKGWRLDDDWGTPLRPPTYGTVYAYRPIPDDPPLPAPPEAP